MDSELRKYITCWNNCSLRHIEALAMLGLVVKAEAVECGDRGFMKINATLFDGGHVDSACFHSEEVKQSLRIINIYIGFARSKGSLGKLTVVDTKGASQEA
ncbi:hypothetical protein [Desulfurococcus mucosus]|uniref:Uncharacterized protein n=1 Tax=Desulfurococcus mucosus (strain ATCC 35584 / DSM 2162 / JCM 9187 / O7/1) TaxID=765177 RepID=E8R7K6_DESM0|nr:hypothetical protein [Desulfurococcus mucosus]ADV64501.1 hypothetical protein Desmu_0182 [Desulfurococcus mucosus DSM 2162]